MPHPDTRFLIIWVIGASILALLLFGLDKLKARRGRSRISEFHLCLVSACGGWPGGLLGMLLFRHKTAKLSFACKFAVAFIAWAGAIAWLITHH